MHKLLSAVGWIMIVGGIVAGIATHYVVGTQDIFLSLLARVVERPYEYRDYLALGAGAGIGLFGVLVGLLYVGLGQVLGQRSGS